MEKLKLRNNKRVMFKAWCYCFSIYIFISVIGNYNDVEKAQLYGFVFACLFGWHYISNKTKPKEQVFDMNKLSKAKGQWEK